jgi:hypothetical protein
VDGAAGIGAGANYDLLARRISGEQGKGDQGNKPVHFVIGGNEWFGRAAGNRV